MYNNSILILSCFFLTVVANEPTLNDQISKSSSTEITETQNSPFSSEDLNLMAELGIKDISELYKMNADGMYGVEVFESVKERRMESK